MKLTYKDLLISTAICFAAFIILILLNGTMENNLVFNSSFGIRFIYILLFTFTIGYANKFLFLFFDKLFVEDRFSVKRILIGFVSSYVSTLFVIYLLQIFKGVIMEERSFRQFFAKENPGTYGFAIFMTFIIVLSFQAFYFFKAYNENKFKEQKIIAGTANAKFESLKNQIDPHFLFNSLNVLSSLIEENPENAQRFTTSLSKIYRYVLEQKDKDLVSVDEELAFAKTYMNLLKMRFENSLFYELPTANINPEAKVVPLSLQLLLENTVKHNVVSEQRPLHIRIYIEGDYVVIQNNYQKKEVLQDRQGVGLQNIINRCGIISNRKVLIEQNEQIFRVKIPILTKQIIVMETTTNYNENTAYYRAKKRVEELKGFYGNLISYFCVIPLLVFINLTYSPQFQWFWFSAGGWGFGVVMHALKVFGYSSNWEERKIKEILRKDENKQTWE